MIDSSTGTPKKWISTLLAWAMLGGLLFGFAPQKAEAAVSDVTVQLTDSDGDPLAGATVSYYDAGWQTFGTTDATGAATKSLTEKTYTFHIEYEGTYLEKAQDTGADPLVAFQTVNVRAQLKDSQGNPLEDGVVSYYGAGGWKTFGNATGGEVGKELLPGNYTFHMDYEGTRMDKAQDTGADPVVVFQTVNARVQLKNSQNNPLSGGVVSYYATGWRTFGTTVNGEASKQLLPGSYTFAMNYDGTTTQKAGDLAASPIVLFQVQTSGVVAPKQSGQYDPIPVPPSDRPRVLVNNQTLPALKAKLANPAFNAVWTTINAKAQIQKSGNFPPRSSTANTNIDASTVDVMKANAIRYLIYDDAAAGQKAVQIAVNMANTVQFNPDRSNSTTVFNVAREIGDLIFIESIVYDWCNSLMDETQKAAIRLGLDTWVRNGLEYNYPLDNNQKVIIAGHANGEVHHQFKLAMAIALYDTNPEYYEDIADFLLNKTMPGFNVMLDAEMPFEGPAYGDNRLKYIMLGNELWKAIGVHPLTEKAGLALDREVYTRRPDGYIMTEGDDFNTIYKTPWTRTVHGNITSMIAGSVYNNPRAQYEFLKQGVKENELYYLLFYDPNAASQSVYDTPLSRYFPAPYGSIVARTGWDEGQDSKAVVAVMNIGERTQTNHQHADAGAFSMYYKGYLAVDSGIYSGLNPVNGAAMEYGSVHDLEYHKQSIAHNVVQIEDPAALEQGTYSPSNQLYLDRIPKSVEEWNTDPRYQRGTVLSHAIGDDEMYPDYSYIKGELSEAYGKSRTDKYTRSMAFLNFKDDARPAAMVVYDNIDTPNANAEKRWLLHSAFEPAVDGNRYTSEVTERGYDGKLVTDTLLPKIDDLNVEKIGGPGCVNEIDGKCEFEVDGVNKPIKPYNASNIAVVDAGKWRLEVSSETATNQTRFLNVMQVMDAVDGPAPQDVHYSETDDYAGARIQDRVVFFAKDFELTDQQATIAFTGEANQTYKILVTDLEDGYWTAVKQGETATAKYQAVQEGNSIYFEGTPGTYTLQKADASPLPLAGEVPSEPAGRKIRVRIDAQGLDLDVPPVLNNNVVMVPMKNVYEAMGMTVSWNAATQTATATKGTSTVQFTAGSNIAKVNGANKTMDAPATGLDNQMLIPHTFIPQSGLRFAVAWDAVDQVVGITWTGPSAKLQFQEQALAPVNPIPIADLKEIKYKSFRATQSAQNVWKMFDDIPSDPSRWSGDKAAHVIFDFGSAIQLERLDATVFNWGQTRSNKLMISVSQDGDAWTNVYGGVTAPSGDGHTDTFNFPSVSARYVRVAVFGSPDATVNPDFVSFSELKFFVEK